uniref:Uncharacterized protein n=1 Tax=Parascaris univalens TaxID=6257 RepID=A0A915C8W6_PARUN
MGFFMRNIFSWVMVFFYTNYIRRSLKTMVLFYKNAVLLGISLISAVHPSRVFTLQIQK